MLPSRGPALAALLAGALVACDNDAPPYRVQGGDDLVGRAHQVRVEEATPADQLARRFGVGARELRYVNPSLRSGRASAGTELNVPSEYILPPAPRRGIVINLAEKRLYYFADGDGGEVLTFPVAIGRDEWETPTGRTQVIERIEDPEWVPPDSVRADAQQHGRTLPAVVPAGTDNPLGRYALRLSWRTHLIHGTNDPFSVGKAATHGCIRLYPEDMEALYRRVPVGTPVTLIDVPYKFGLREGELYVEAHPPDDGADADALRDRFMQELAAYLRQHRGPQVNWAAVVRALTLATGIPERVSAG